MKKKQHNRKNRILIAYTMRTIVFLLLVGILFLMICGCLYLHDIFIGNKTTSNAAAAETYLETAGQDKENSKTSVWSDANTHESTVIILDAGHGGYDDGTFHGEGKEKEINLLVVQQMQTLLEQNGVTVILTREDDEFVSLENRVNIANESTADLFVSIHCNYYDKDISIKGLECYYMENAASGKQYAESIIDNMQKRGNIVVRNAKPEDYYVLKYTEIPAVLIELGYLSNSEECLSLTTADYQKKLAEELVECILQSINHN